MFNLVNLYLTFSPQENGLSTDIEHLSLSHLTQENAQLNQ